MALEAQAYRGQRLGLPPDGPGSVADFAPRLGAFVVDCVASALVAAAVVSAVHHGGDAASRLPGNWSLIPFALDYLVGLVLAGRTLGMYLVGLRVIRVDRPAAINLLQAFERTVLLALVIPAVIWDRDRRGFHDRLTKTAVVRA
jgi:uncharacterized RDD family membrane protein YckC